MPKKEEKAALIETAAAKTISVPDAGRLYFGLGRNAAYEAAKRGDIPTIRIGKLLRVPVVALERMLERASGASEPTQVKE
ncbi:MAG: helix-turn-helix domain-containing protein [Magnetovibrionaceae bacterium]